MLYNNKSNLTEKIIIKKGDKKSFLYIFNDCDIKYNFLFTEECITDFYFIFIGDKNVANIDFDISGDKSLVNVNILSILINNSDFEINGSINIKEGVKLSHGSLTQDNIILGDNFVLKNKPILNIASNQISANHGAKVHNIDPQKLFYLTSRGLNIKDAKKLIIEGLIENYFEKGDILDTKESRVIKNDIYKIIFSSK